MSEEIKYSLTKNEMKHSTSPLDNDDLKFDHTGNLEYAQKKDDSNFVGLVQFNPLSMCDNENFIAMIVGKRNSGRSTLLCDLINTCNPMCNLGNKFQQIIYFLPTGMDQFTPRPSHENQKNITYVPIDAGDEGPEKSRGMVSQGCSWSKK